ncbi:MAG: hypothetical protein ABI548_15115 [Polyangiaceae bacterium]
MRGSGLVWSASALGAALAFTAVTTTAQAQSSPTPAVWYRASAECPTGPEFLSKIADSSTRARLAQAGDHIDFVVTLLAANGETVGRLERQTNGGTVAIRELRDVTCAQVAEALALSLGLALDPASPASEAAAPEVARTPEVVAAPAPTVSPPTRAIAPTPSASPTQMKLDHPPTQTQTQSGRTFGVEAGALTGLGTRSMLRGSAFLDFARVTHHLSVRVAVVGALGSSPTPFGSVSRWLLAGRSEVCPWRWGGARLDLSPCAAFELGATSASVGEHSDHALWAAPGVGVRASVAIVPWFRLEAGAGVLLPVLRAHVFYGAQPLYQDEIIAFQATLGVSFGQP